MNRTPSLLFTDYSINISTFLDPSNSGNLMKSSANNKLGLLITAWARPPLHNMRKKWCDCLTEFVRICINVRRMYIYTYIFIYIVYRHTHIHKLFTYILKYIFPQRITIYYYYTNIIHRSTQMLAYYKLLSTSLNT